MEPDSDELLLPVAALRRRRAPTARTSRGATSQHVRRVSRPTSARRSASSSPARTANGSSTATSAQTAVISGAPVGRPRAPADDLGQRRTSPRRLHADPGTWNGNPTGYAYLWQRCPAPRAPATARSPSAAFRTTSCQAGDVGFTLQVRVTATNPAGSGLATTTRTAVVQGSPSSATPTISGTAVAGQTLTADEGSWGDTPTFTYQWRRCDSGGANCADIAGATAKTYVVQNADVDSTLRVVVTGTNPGGSQSATSDPTAVVTGAPFNTSPPTITGSTVQGSTLTADPGTWGGNPVGPFAYQWQRCDARGRELHRHLPGHGADVRDPGGRRRKHDPRGRLGDERASAPARRTPTSPWHRAAPRARFGPTTAGGQSESGTAAHDYILSSGPYTMPVDGTVSKLSGYLSDASGGSVLRAVIYTDDGTGKPGTFVAVSSEVTTPTTPGWVDFPFSGAVSLPAGQYWLGYWLGVNTASLFFDNATGAEWDVDRRDLFVCRQSAVEPYGRLRPRRSVLALRDLPGGPDQERAVRRHPAADGHGRPVRRADADRRPRHLEPEPDRATPTSGSAATTPAPAAPTSAARPTRPTSCRPRTSATRCASSSPRPNDLGDGTANSDRDRRGQRRPDRHDRALDLGPDGHRRGAAPRRHADRRPGRVDGQPDELHVPVVPCSAAPARASPARPARPTSCRPADVGYTIKVEVTAIEPRRPGDGGLERDRRRSAPARSTPPSRRSPARRSEGSTLTGSTGTWDYSPTSYAYQWQRCDAAGANCVDIGGATSSTYVVQAADVTHTLVLAVTATNAAGPATATSDPTAVVLGIPSTPRCRRSAATSTRAALTADERHLEREPDRLRVPVAALRLGRQQLLAIGGETYRRTRWSPPTSARRSGSSSPRRTRTARTAPPPTRPAAINGPPVNTVAADDPRHRRPGPDAHRP